MVLDLSRFVDPPTFHPSNPGRNVPSFRAPLPAALQSAKSDHHALTTYQTSNWSPYLWLVISKKKHGLLAAYRWPKQGCKNIIQYQIHHQCKLQQNHIPKLSFNPHRMGVTTTAVPTAPTSANVSTCRDIPARIDAIKTLLENDHISHLGTFESMNFQKLPLGYVSLQPLLRSQWAFASVGDSLMGNIMDIFNSYWLHFAKDHDKTHISEYI